MTNRYGGQHSYHQRIEIATPKSLCSEAVESYFGSAFSSVNHGLRPWVHVLKHRARLRKNSYLFKVKNLTETALLFAGACAFVYCFIGQKDSNIPKYFYRSLILGLVPNGSCLWLPMTTADSCHITSILTSSWVPKKANNGQANIPKCHRFVGYF